MWRLIKQTLTVLLALILPSEAWSQAQQQFPVVPPVAQPNSMPQFNPQSGLPADAEGDKLRLNYVLDSSDQILIRVPQAEELNEKAFKIENDGNVYLPLVGTLRAAGKTVQQFEAELVQQISMYYRSPSVIVTVIQYRSDPVIFIGAFRSPGIYPLQGRRTLVEMLTTLGGLQPNASRRLRITRRMEWGRIPLPEATEDSERNVSTVDISVNRLLETVNPQEDIVLQPYDVIRVGAEEMVYLNGQVSKAYPLNDRDSITVLQLISLSGGLPNNAALDKARVLRPVLDTNRRAEIPLNVADIIDGKANDFPLLPNDVLFIPPGKNTGRTIGRFIGAIVPGIVISMIYVAIRDN
jgi:polysaccharide export outer membrane protein